jgi:hypothetical protein
MTNKIEIAQSTVCTTVEKIEHLIREKRAPFEARQEHVASLEADILDLSAEVDKYLASPTPANFQAARKAEIELVASQSLRERLGELDINTALTPVLDQAFEAVPLFEGLADENTAFLTQCRERFREFRVARAASDEANPLVDLQLAIYGREIEEAEKQNKGVTHWIKAWGRGDHDSPLWAFWPIYRALKNLKVKLYVNTREMPVPDGYCRPAPFFDLTARAAAVAGKALIPDVEPEEALATVSASSTTN